MTARKKNVVVVMMTQFPSQIRGSKARSILEALPNQLLFANGEAASADYDGLQDNNVYPMSADNVWAAEDIEFSKAPYAAALPDGRFVMASQTPQIVRVWVGDTEARNFRPQELPFGMARSIFPVIEPISDTEVLVAAGSYLPNDNFIYLRIGTIAP